MSTCTAQSGFLTMSGCDNTATTVCASCGSPRCPIHLSPRSGFTQCLECANREPQPEQEEADYDEDWSYRYRDSYYSSSGYRPHSSYDETDSAAFVDGERMGDDERDDASFGDS